jgi:putative DNA primase/helicase
MPPRTPISTCATCGVDTIEPEANPTPIVIEGVLTLVCPACRSKARRGQLAAEFRPGRQIAVETPPLDPRLAMAEHLETLYSPEGIRAALQGEDSPWRFLDILDERIKKDENTPNGDVARAMQPFRGLFVEKLIGLASDGELHLLVSRGQTRFRYDSTAVEREVREARVADQAVRSAIIQEPDQWPEPVDGAVLADEIVRMISRYVWMSEAKTDAVMLYIFFTHAIEAFSIAPILGIESPAPECGKSTLATLVRHLVFRGLPCSNVTGAALFRAIEKWKPTFVLDEADSFLTDKRNEDLRGIIDSGHTRDLAYVIRSGTKEEGYEPRVYSTFGPKVIAVIGRLPHTIESRQIKIKLKRMRPGEDVEKWRHYLVPTLRPLQRRLARWVADNGEILHAAREPITLEGLGNRANDNWDALLYIADLLGGTWPKRAREAALEISGLAVQAEQIAGIEMLADLRRFFFSERFTKPDAKTGSLREKKGSTDSILTFLNGDPERPWATWKRGRPLDAKGLARLLNPFDVKSVNLKLKRDDGSEYVVKGYRGEDPKILEAFASYLPPLSPQETPSSAATPATSEQNQVVRPQNAPATEASGSGTENGHFPNDSASVAGVAGKSADSGERRGVGAIDPAVFLRRTEEARRRAEAHRRRRQTAEEESA